MVHIHSVQQGTPEVEAARALFAGYRDFLETAASTHCFDFPRYLLETAALPTPYTDANGELLLAMDGEVPGGCIAFRYAAREPETTCEIKRLFVAPECRRQGIAQLLIGEAMRRAADRGFTRAILDTDVASMAAAYAIYRECGFTEYTQPGTHPPSLRFLERQIHELDRL